MTKKEPREITFNQKISHLCWIGDNGNVFIDFNDDYCREDENVKVQKGLNEFLTAIYISGIKRGKEMKEIEIREVIGIVMGLD